MAVKIAKWRDQVIYAENGSVKIINERTGKINYDAPTTARFKALHFAQQAALMKVDDWAYSKFQDQRREYNQLAQDLLEVASEAEAQAYSGIQLPAITNEERQAREMAEELNARVSEARDGVYSLDFDRVKLNKLEDRHR